MIAKTMDLDETKQKRWRETEALIDRFENYPQKTSSFDILRLGALYTELISDLNKLSSCKEDPETRQKINKLALRAYGLIYQGKAMGIMDLLVFFLFDFPAIVRKRIHFVIASTLIFLVSALIGFLCINEKSKLIDLVISPEAQSVYQQSIKHIDPEKPRISSSESNFGISSFIMTNNIRVSIKAFATGIFLGIGTIFILIFNGLLLGGLASLYQEGGLASFFWSLILPHGFLELTCIFICGAAGMIIGYALINPGKFHRKDALVREGEDSIKMVVGVIPLLVLAALIEAYITPAKLPEIFKFVFSGISLVTIIAFFAFSNKALLKSGS